MTVGVGGVCSLISEVLVSLNKGVPPPAYFAWRGWFRTGLPFFRGHYFEMWPPLPNLTYPEYLSLRNQRKGFYRTKWVVLFSHPADFTPVCTTELGRIAVSNPKFVQRNVKLLALSCDKLQDHTDWVNIVDLLLSFNLGPIDSEVPIILSKTVANNWKNDIKSYCLDIPGEFPYPIVSDETRDLAVMLDMLDEENKDNPDTAMTVRALYIISPDHKMRLSMIYPTSTGRNVEEILRVIDSLQLCDRLKVVATPASWTPGEKVMILPHVKDEELPSLFPKGVDKVSMPSGKVYVRTTTDY
ncbi:activity protein [Homalodisca vitripennis]|nr:activity protein [Homalodisca vitripennis]